MKNEYWAALPADGDDAAIRRNADKCHTVALEKIGRYYDVLKSNGMMGLWRRLHRAYHSGYYMGGKMSEAGSEGELRYIEVNHLANLIRHTVALTTANRLEWDAKAMNADMKSIEQCKLASGLLDYYWRVKRVDARQTAAFWNGCLYGRAGIHQVWQGGDDGDVVFDELTPDRMVVDADRISGADQWYIVRDLVDVHDLIARYPSLEDLIMAGKSIDRSWYICADEVKDVQGDMCEAWTLYHDRTPACPQGRRMVFTKGAWLEDGVLDYARMPVIEYKPEAIKGTKWGYSIAFDLLPIQEYINGLFSSVASNQSAYGIQNVLIPDESNITVDMIAQQMRAIRYTAAAGKPEILQLLDTPAEIPRMIEMLKNEMQMLAGIDSVTRGLPDPSLKSGSALAMVQSMAVQFNGVAHAGFVQMHEESGALLIKTLQRKAAAPRVAMISGRGNRSELRQFTGDDLSAVQNVFVDAGSPMSRTPEQKRALAEFLAGTGVKLDANQLITLYQTGRIEPVYEDVDVETTLIRSENDMISRGQVPQVLAIDDHPYHIRSHKKAFSNVDARTDDPIVAAGLEHVQRHIMAMRNVDPDLLAVLGIKSLAAPPAPMGDGGGAPPAPEGGLQAPEGMPAGAPALPNLPTNPATGQRAEVPGVA